MFREFIEYGKSIREEMKAIVREIKKNAQGTKVEGRKPGFKSMIWNIKKKKIFNQNSKKKKQSEKRD